MTGQGGALLNTTAGPTIQHVGDNDTPANDRLSTNGKGFPTALPRSRDKSYRQPEAEIRYNHCVFARKTSMFLCPQDIKSSGSDEEFGTHFVEVGTVRGTRPRHQMREVLFSLGSATGARQKPQRTASKRRRTREASACAWTG